MALYQVRVNYTTRTTITSLVFVEADTIEDARDMVYQGEWKQEVFGTQFDLGPDEIMIEGSIDDVSELWAS